MRLFCSAVPKKAQDERTSRIISQSLKATHNPCDVPIDNHQNGSKRLASTELFTYLSLPLLAQNCMLRNQRLRGLSVHELRSEKQDLYVCVWKHNKSRCFTIQKGIEQDATDIFFRCLSTTDVHPPILSQGVRSTGREAPPPSID